MNKEINAIEFQPIKDDERPSSYDMRKFIIFYGDIIDKLWIGLPLPFSK